MMRIYAAHLDYVHHMFQPLSTVNRLCCSAGTVAGIHNRSSGLVEVEADNRPTVYERSVYCVVVFRPTAHLVRTSSSE